MNALRSLLLLFIVAVVAAPMPGLQAEILGPGEYQGWIVKDRWNTLHLANGVYLLPIIGPAREKAIQFVGSSVSVQVTEIHPGMELDDQAIAGISKIEKIPPAADLEIEVTRRSGSTLNLDIRLQYRTKEPAGFDSRELKVMVRRRSTEPLENLEALDAKDERGTPWLRGGSGGSVLKLDGPVVETFWTWTAPGGRFRATGPFTYKTSIEVKLPPGECEARVIYGDANFSGAPCGLSRPVKFR